MSALGELFTDIANAIRTKTGEEGTMKPAEFPAKIEGIEAGSSNDLATQFIEGTVTTIESNAVSVVSYCFSNGQGANLTSVSLPQAKSVGVYAFKECKNLTSVALPQVTTVDSGAFEYCSNLTSVALPQVTTVGSSAFSSCTKLTSVDLPQVTTLGLRAFSSCSLSSVNVPQITTIPQACFQGNLTLTSFIFENVISIETTAFQNCGFSEINIPNITRMETRVFYGNIKLTRAYLPNVTSIASEALYSCKNLEVLVLNSPVMCTLENTNSLYNTKITGLQGYIYVPRALIDQYKAATNWSTYANQFRALEDYTVDGTTTGELDETKI